MTHALPPDTRIEIIDDLALEFEQYRSLRAEIIQSMNDGNTIMAFGLTAIGLLLGPAVGARNDFVGFLLLALLLPLSSGIVLSLWFAAQERIARASHFLSGIEDRLAGRTGTAHTWERWLRMPQPGNRSNHFWSTEQAGIGLFAVLAMCSVGASFTSGTEDVSVAARAVVVATTACCGGAFALNIRRRYVAWQRWLSSSFGTL